MAWIYSLSAEFGSDKEAAHQFMQQATDIAAELVSGMGFKVRAFMHTDYEDNCWVMIIPYQPTNSGMDFVSCSKLQEEFREPLYRTLRSVRGVKFRYALVGLEVDEFRTFSELRDESNLSIFKGLVINKDLLEELRVPSSFRPFGSGYVWLPY